MDALTQFAIADVLLTHWEVIALKLGPVSPALAAAFADIGAQLAAASAPDQINRCLNDLFDLTDETPAGVYVAGLLERADLGQEGTKRAAALVVESSPVSQAIQQQAGALALQCAVAIGDQLARIETAPGVERVPVFFATNRKPAATGDGRFFLGDIADQTRFGVALVTLPARPVHKLGQVERPAWWNRFADGSDAQRYVVLRDVVQLANPAEFQSALAEAAGAARTSDILVFVHGFNVTFEDAALRAAQFAADSGFAGPVVLFSWASWGSLARYPADETRARDSIQPMSEFLALLEGGPWPKVHLLAHSMGNRVMLGALAAQPESRLPLSQLIFAAADLYVNAFRDAFTLLREGRTFNATSYASRRDRALLASFWLHQGEARIGLIRDTPYSTDGLATIDTTAVDRGFLGHGYWSDERPLLTDVTTLLQGLDPAARGLKPVDRYWIFPE